jgi:hypothetical protein
MSLLFQKGAGLRLKKSKIWFRHVIISLINWSPWQLGGASVARPQGLPTNDDHTTFWAGHLSILHVLLGEQRRSKTIIHFGSGIYALPMVESLGFRARLALRICAASIQPSLPIG